MVLVVILLSGCADYHAVRSTGQEIMNVGNAVLAEGRWKALPGTTARIISRINFTSITCDRNKGSCYEVISLVRNPKEDTMYKSHMLFSNTFSYRITDWANDIIKAKYEAPVGDAEITISLKDSFAEKSWRETKLRGSEDSDPNIYGKWMLE